MWTHLGEGPGKSGQGSFGWKIGSMEPLVTKVMGNKQGRTASGGWQGLCPLPTWSRVTCSGCNPIVNPWMLLTWDVESADQVLLGPACHRVGSACILGMV